MVLLGCKHLQLLQSLKYLLVASQLLAAELYCHVEEQENDKDVDQALSSADDVE